MDETTPQPAPPQQEQQSPPHSTITPPLAIISSLGLEGIWSKVANFSAVVIMAGVMVYLVVALQDHLAELRTDMKADRESHRLDAKQAHEIFATQAERDRVAEEQQLGVMREYVRGVTSIRQDIKTNQATIAELIVELKKTKASIPKSPDSPEESN